MIAEARNCDDTQGLISLERAEKFDLLAQLILNQREAIILCGAEGIGKTTLLKTLKESREHLWTICVLQGTVQFNFDYIKKTLSIAIKEYGSIPDSESLHDMLNFYAEHQQKVVLILDNAASLAEGLVNKLIEYALDYPAIRIIFALTKEELILKNNTDTAIDDCYFMEIPPLDKQQVGVFLKLLSTRPEGLITEDEIDDRLLNKLYQRTGGIPGIIVDELQELQEQQGEDSFKWQKILLFSSCILAGFSLIYLYEPMFDGSSSQKSKPKIYQVAQAPKQTIAVDEQVTEEATLVVNEQNKQLVSNDLIEKKELEVKKLLKQQQEIEASIKQKELEKKQESKVQQQIRIGDDKQWVLQQSARKYSLQLMVASNKKALQAVLARHPILRNSLKYVGVIRKHKQQYILLYGSFANSKVAQKAIKNLPEEFKQAWPKRFNAIQKEIKNSP